MRENLKRRWSLEDDKKLSEIYMDKKDSELADIFNRTEKAIKSRLGFLGLNRELKLFYTARDIEIYKSGDYTKKELAEMFGVSFYTVISNLKRFKAKAKSDKNIISEHEIKTIKRYPRIKNKNLAIMLKCDKNRVCRIKTFIKKLEG